MTIAENHIRHYNNLNGKEISKETLSRFHAALKKDIDMRRIDAHVPYGVECIAMEKRIAKAIKEMNGANRIVHCSKTISLGKPKNLLITQTAMGPEVVRAKKAMHYHHEDVTVLFGLECIQDDKDLSSKPLDGVSDTTYKVVTDRIIELIKKDGLVWRHPWNAGKNGSLDFAHNGVTKHVYSGGNMWLNWVELDSPMFFTFKQVKDLGGTVNKGAKGWPVVYFKWLYVDRKTRKSVSESIALDANGKLKPGYDEIPMLLYYTVFNFKDCSGLKIKHVPEPKRTEKEKIDSAEEIVKAMPMRPEILKGHDQAYYKPSADTVTMPPMAYFDKEPDYYSVLFHELIHSTGSPKRVGRTFGGKGTKAYYFEELIAEIGACFLCAESGILYHTLNNSAAYIQGYKAALMKEMTEDPKFFLQACSQAQKAANFILGESKVDDKKNKEEKKEAPEKKSKATTKATKKKDRSPIVKEPSIVDKLKEKHEKETDERLKEGRKILDKAKEKQDAAKPKNQSSVTDLPLEIIHTDTKRFQNRRSEFSEATAQSVAENYDPNKFDPIVVWLDPEDEKIYVLSGHSRFEGMRRRKAKEISVRYFQGSLEEAIKFAKVDANRSASQETLIEDLAAYKLMRDGDAKRNIKPVTKGELQKIFKGRSQRLEAYSSLNTDGLFINALSQGTASNYPYLERNAQWVGSLREFYPQISNTGEDNIFHFFYADKTGKHIKLSKDEFQKLVENKVNSLSTGEGILFPECSSDGCKKSVDKEADPMKGEAHKRLREINEMLRSINDKLTSKDPLVRVTTQHERDYLIKTLAPKLNEEKNRIERDLHVMDKTQTTLFGNSKGLSGLGFITADQTPDQKSDTFTLPGPIGSLLGQMQRYKLEIVIAGETHSGKSEIGKQIADAFLTAGYTVGWVDWEQGGLQSRDTKESIARNVSEGNRKKLMVSAEVPKTMEAVKSLAGKFEVVCLDSGSSLKQVTNEWIDELREQYPDTIWIILMQQNTKGGTRGGSAAEFDSPVVLKTYRPDHADYKKNYAYVFKNRGNPQTTGKYFLITEKKMIATQPGADAKPLAA